MLYTFNYFKDNVGNCKNKYKFDKIKNKILTIWKISKNFINIDLKN